MDIQTDFFGSTISTLRCNRSPTVAELSSIAAQIESNKTLIASLTNELERRRKIVQLTSASLQARLEDLDHARHHWEAASSYLNELSPIQKTLQDTLISLNREDTQNSITGATSITTGYEAQVQAIGVGLTENFGEAMENISIITRGAESSYLVAGEKHQDALFELDLAKKSATTVEDLIERVKGAIGAEEEAVKSRKMWELPPETWAQIFTEATVPDKSFQSMATLMPTGWPHGARAMLLASVCRKWRQLCIGQNSLWATINIASTHYPQPGFVQLHMARKGRLPCSLVVNADTYAWSAGRWWQGSFARLDELHLLHLCVHPNALHQVGLMSDLIPLAIELILESPGPSRVVTVNVPIDRESRTKKLALSFTHNTQVCQAALTHISLDYGDLTGHGDIHLLAPNSVTSLEHAVLRHASSHLINLEPRITLPCLEYLETNLGLLVNRLHLLYHMPKLRKLVITSIGTRLGVEWGGVAVELGRDTQVERIEVREMGEEDVEEVISQVHLFPGLSTIELHGESVEPALHKLQEALEGVPPNAEGNKLVLSLKEMVIVDYSGNGSDILEFVLCGDTKGMQITTQVVNCPNVTLDSLKLLRQMNQERGKSEL